MVQLGGEPGEVEAVRQRDALSAKMTLAQVAAAQERAAQWRPEVVQSAQTAQAVAASPDTTAPVSSVPATDPPPRPASREEIREAQVLLARLGHDPGPVDGQWGARTARAYSEFLRDAGLPSAETLTPSGLVAMGAEMSRRQGTSGIAGVRPPPSDSGEPDRVVTMEASATPSMAETIGSVANVVIHGIIALELAKMAKDPESFERVAPELQKLLTKMLSGFSSSELSNAGDADISLVGLTMAERSRMSELLKEEQGLPEETRVALGNALRADAAPVTALEPKCARAAEGAECWKVLANKLDCHIWDNYYYADQSVTWSGACIGGVADGQGTSVWIWDDEESVSDTGTLSNGKAQGHWVARFSDGRTWEGPYVDGEKNGHWVESHVGMLGNILIWEGPYVDGERNGHWVERFGDRGTSEGPDGGTSEGPYLDGQKNGHWVTKFADGGIWEGPMVEGKKNGHWIEKSIISSDLKPTSEGSYVDGKKHGHWVTRWAHGDVTEGQYVDGKEHGRWIERSADGRCEMSEYSHGRLDENFIDAPCH